MASLRKSHDEGPTRVSISGEYVMTGGSDGVVALFASKRWPQTAALWARQCHSAAVTCVVLEADLQLGFSCGRDGLVVLHENLLAGADTATARVICRVTGEVRCICFDTARRRVFVGGDSLRCLQMGAQRYDIYTIPLVVPHPIVAMAVSPCGNLMAMASASRAVGVLCVTPGRYTSAAATPQTAAAAQGFDSALQTSDETATAASQLTRFFDARFVFPDLLPAAARHVDGCAYRLSWAAVATEAAAPQALLFVPATAEVRVLRFTVAMSAPYRHTMCAIGSLQPATTLSGCGPEADMTGYRSALAYAITPHRVMCVMSTDTHLYAVKLDDRTLKTTPFFTHGFDTAVTDVDVNRATGEAIVGLASGAVSLLRRAAARQTTSVLPEAQGSASSPCTRSEALQRAVAAAPCPPTSAPLSISSMASQYATSGAATAAPAAPVPGEVGRAGTDLTRRRARDKDDGSTGRGGVTVDATRTTTFSAHGVDKDERNGGAGLRGGRGSDDGSSSDSAKGSRKTSSSSGGSSDSSDSDTEAEDEEGLDVKEDLAQVVVDLKRSNPLYDEAAAETERPSRWRQARPEEALAAAAREAARQRSRYLDDEAEEVSSSEAEAEDEAVYADDGYGLRRRGGGGERHVAGGAGDGEDDGRDDDVSGAEDEADATPPAIDDDDDDGGVADGDAARGTPRVGRAPGFATAVTDYSFQVGATPVGPEGACYLAYNAVGYIHCTREAVTVYFHDVAYPAVRIPERSATTLMGTLSPVGAGFVLARDEVTTAEGRRLGPETDGQPDETGARPDPAPRLEIYYRTFVALGAQTEWRVRLQPGETVRCLAAGIRFLAVATSRYLRLFSLSGLELAVLSRSARIVTMVATSSRKLMSSFRADFDPLAIVYLQGGAGELMMEVLDVGSRTSVIAPQPLPLTGAVAICDGGAQRQERAHQLQWLGWSEDGPLHTVDTAGVVRLFTENWGGAWVPVFDPRLLPDQTYHLWVWNVSDEYLFAYRAARDTAPYPAAAATGLPSEHVRLFLPLARTGPERTLATWDHLLRREVRTDELKRHSAAYTEAIAKHDALHDKKIMELFQLALREQQTTRALDLATMLELRDNVELCAKQANNEGHVQLVHKLISLYDLRMKAKAKRKCTLPLENSLVTERERDLLLRRLLAKEKAAHYSSATDTAPRLGGAIPTAPATASTVAIPVGAAPLSSLSSRQATEEGRRGNVGDDQTVTSACKCGAELPESPGKASVRSAATTTATITAKSMSTGTSSTKATMPSILKAPHHTSEHVEGLPVRRHVTFDLVDRAATSQETTLTTLPSETDAVRPVAAAKPVNPFTHKAPLRSTTLHAAASSSGPRLAVPDVGRASETMRVESSTVGGDVVGNASAVEGSTQMRPKSVNAQDANCVKEREESAAVPPLEGKSQRTLLRTPHLASRPTSGTSTVQGWPVTLLGDSQSTDDTPGEPVMVAPPPPSLPSADVAEAGKGGVAAPSTAASQRVIATDTQDVFAAGVARNKEIGQPTTLRFTPRALPETAAVLPQLCVPSATDPFLTLDGAECFVSDGDGGPPVGSNDATAKASARNLPYTREVLLHERATATAMAATLPSYTSSASLASIDETRQQQQTGGMAAEGLACTVQTMLDVGHEDSGVQPRSRSFGEALRKRYREDEDEESTADELTGAHLPVPQIIPR